MGRLSGRDLLIATGNAGKLAEFQALLSPFGTRLHSLATLGLPEPDETEFSFTGNALVKARAGMRASGLPTLADDSGLEVAALGGAPGIYTADWAETEHGRDFHAAMRKTWGLMTAAGPARGATFCCVLALVWPDGQSEVFEGRLRGEIVWPMRGETGHGYDPIFQPLGDTRTMGEMHPEEKNTISHRSVAVRRFISACFT